MSTHDLKRLEASSSLLVVIDVQERLLPAMEDTARGRLTANLARLGAASGVLGYSTLITEQYPRGLGATVGEVKEAFSGVEPLPKVTFDAFADDAIGGRLEAIAPSTVLVTGMETHICVFQTVRSLVDRGYRTMVIEDAVASRTVENRALGLQLARRAGAIVTSTETVLFDLLGQAGGDAFKAISKLVR